MPSSEFHCPFAPTEANNAVDPTISVCHKHYNLLARCNAFVLRVLCELTCVLSINNLSQFQLMAGPNDANVRLVSLVKAYFQEYSRHISIIIGLQTCQSSSN